MTHHTNNHKLLKLNEIREAVGDHYYMRWQVHAKREYDSRHEQPHTEQRMAYVYQEMIRRYDMWKKIFKSNCESFVGE